MMKEVMITVLFASGNGGEPFPRMHPDVISVGGVLLIEMDLWR